MAGKIPLKVEQDASAAQRSEPGKIQLCLRRSRITWRARGNLEEPRNTRRAAEYHAGRIIRLERHGVCGLGKDFSPSNICAKNNTDLDRFHNSISRQNSNAQIAFVRLTASVTRLGWEGGFTLETGVRRSQENAEKRGAYPKSGARIVSCVINAI